MRRLIILCLVISIDVLTPNLFNSNHLELPGEFRLKHGRLATALHLKNGITAGTMCVFCDQAGIRRMGRVGSKDRSGRAVKSTKLVGGHRFAEEQG
jgi:hypothetical protein